MSSSSAPKKLRVAVLSTVKHAYVPRACTTTRVSRPWWWRMTRASRNGSMSATKGLPEILTSHTFEM